MARGRFALLNTRCFIIAVCMLAFGSIIVSAGESDDTFVGSNTAEWSADFYSVGIWSEQAPDRPLPDRVTLAVQAGLNPLDFQVGSSSGSSDFLDGALSDGSGRDELGWILTKTLLNAGINLIDTAFVAYFKFDLH